MRIIAGSKRGAHLKTLEGASTRPTLDRIKENIFNIIQSHLRGAVVLDLFAGSGALGCEALSRGASFVLFNDSSKSAAAVVKENVEKLGFADHAQIWQLDWQSAIKKLLQESKKFDIVLLDAPYDNDFIQRCAKECRRLLNQGGVLVVEHGQGADLEGAPARKYGKVWVSVIEQ